MDSNSFGKAFAEGFPSTVRFLLSRGAMPDEAEEMAQAAWARGWEVRDQLQRQERIVQWINTIARRNLWDEKHRSGRHETIEELADPKPGATHWMARVDAAQLIAKCSPLDRSLLLHRFWGGYSTFEIARLHGLSRIATRVRLHRSWKALRQSMDKVPDLRNRGARDVSPVQVGPGGRISNGKGEQRRSTRQTRTVPIKPDTRAA